MDTAELKKDAEERRDRAKAELKVANDLIKALEGYERLERDGVIAARQGEGS